MLVDASFFQQLAKASRQPEMTVLPHPLPRGAASFDPNLVFNESSG
jgi:hypothetical protein